MAFCWPPALPGLLHQHANGPGACCCCWSQGGLLELRQHSSQLQASCPECDSPGGLPSQARKAADPPHPTPRLLGQTKSSLHMWTMALTGWSMWEPGLWGVGAKAQSPGLRAGPGSCSELAAWQAKLASGPGPLAQPTLQCLLQGLGDSFTLQRGRKQHVSRLQAP